MEKKDGFNSVGDRRATKRRLRSHRHSPDTVRNKVLSGETEILQRDGSRLNYLTLEQAGGLKPRRPAKKRR